MSTYNYKSNSPLNEGKQVKYELKRTAGVFSFGPRKGQPFDSTLIKRQGEVSPSTNVSPNAIQGPDGLYIHYAVEIDTEALQGYLETQKPWPGPLSPNDAGPLKVILDSFGLNDHYDEDVYLDLLGRLKPKNVVAMLRHILCTYPETQDFLLECMQVAKQHRGEFDT